MYFLKLLFPQVRWMSSPICSCTRSVQQVPITAWLAKVVWNAVPAQHVHQEMNPRHFYLMSDASIHLAPCSDNSACNQS